MGTPTPPEFGGSEFGHTEFGDIASSYSPVDYTIGSLLINGVEYGSKLLLPGRSLVYDISNRISTATLIIFGKPTDLATDIKPGKSFEIRNSSSVLIFAGTIARVDPTVSVPEPTGAGVTKFAVTARDFGYLLDSTIISTPIAFTSQTDQAIIQSIFGTYLSSVATTSGTVSVVSTIDTITFDNISIRQALEQLIQLTGAQFWVDQNKALQYHSPSATASPWAISETPNNTTTFNVERKNLQYSKDFSNGANRVTVIGGLGSGGTAYSATVNDTTSQGLYGVLSKVIVDRGITSTAQCTARANVELATYKNPLESGQFSTRVPGLTVGQLLTISLPALNISGDYLIRRVQVSWVSNTVVRYQIQFGAYQPDLVKALRELANTAAESPTAPVAIPATESIVAGHFASTLQAVGLVSTLPTLPSSNYPNNSLVVLTTDSKLYRNASGTWTAAVPTTDLTGQITTTQITDNSVTTAKVNALAITSGLIAANAIVSGKIAAGAVIAGTIAAGAIRASDAAFATAAIQTADIADAAITNAKIVTLSASKLTAGTIDASVITVSNLNASNITSGTLSASRITSGTMNVGSGGLTITGSGTGLTVQGGAAFYAINVGYPSATACQIALDGSITTAAALTFGGSSALTQGSTVRISAAGDGYFGYVAVANNINITSGSITNNGVQVIALRQTDPGDPASLSTVGDVAAWCHSLRACLLNHGLIG